MDTKARAGDERREALIQKNVQKGGFRALVNAKCIECIYDPVSKGNWRKQVEKCTSLACPLYSVRPTSSVEVD